MQPAPTEPEAGTGFGRWLVLLVVGMLVVAVIGYRVLSKPAPLPRPQVAAAAPQAPATTEAPATAEAPAAANVPVPVPDLALSSSAAAPTPDGESHSVTLKSIPPKARFFHFGKEVGTAPFVLEFKPGERHSYEVGLPGYITRKVTLDGSKPEITVGLRKESH
jgi:hypothetical protein